MPGANATGPPPPYEESNSATAPDTRESVPADAAAAAMNSSQDAQQSSESGLPKVLEYMASSKAEVEWADQSLAGLNATIYWIPGEKALFKVWYMPKGLGSRMVKYLYIYPEATTKMSVTGDSTVRWYGQDTLVWTFEMKEPPTLFVYKVFCKPDTETAKTVTKGMYALATQTRFTVRTSLPNSRRIPFSRCLEMCAAVTAQTITSTDKGPSSLFRKVEDPSICPLDAPQAEEQSASAHSGKCTNRGLGPHWHLRVETTDSVSDRGKKRRRESDSNPNLELSAISTGRAFGRFADTLFEASLGVVKTQLQQALATHKQEVMKLLNESEARIVETLREELNHTMDRVQEPAKENVDDGSSHEVDIASLLSKSGIGILDTMRAEMDQRYDGLEELVRKQVREESERVRNNVARGLEQARSAMSTEKP